MLSQPYKYIKTAVIQQVSHGREPSLFVQTCYGGQCGATVKSTQCIFSPRCSNNILDSFDESSKCTDESDIQLEKAASPICVTLAGITIDVKSLHAKARAQISDRLTVHLGNFNKF